MELKNKKKTNKTIFNLHTRINVQTFSCCSADMYTNTEAGELEATETTGDLSAVDPSARWRRHRTPLSKCCCRG